MLPSEDDNVQFNILLEAAQALKELEYLRTDATTLQEVFDAVQSKVDATAKKMGTSFMAMEKNFQDVIRLSQQLQKELAEMEALAPGMGAQTLAANPNMAKLASVQSPFSAVSQTTGWTEVNAIHKEVLQGQMQELKLANATAKEINQQTIAEQEKNAARQRALSLAQQELDAVEKEGLALQNQLRNYGQISRTSQEMTQYLRSFAGTQQGQGILSQFFGDYNAAKNVGQQINTIQTAISSLSKATGATFAQSGQLIKEQFSALPGIANQVNQSVRQLGSGFESVGVSAKSGIEQALTGINAMRIALGAIISMLLFQVIQAFTEAFQGAIRNARELEASLYRLHNAEKILSGEGIEVSMKGLEEGIKRIRKLMPIFSKEDIAGLVGQVAITTKDLGLTEKQIIDLAEAIGVLNINSVDNESLQQTAQKVMSSLLTSNAKGVANLGLKLGDAALQAKGLEMGFLAAGEGASALTEHEKGIVKVAIAIDTANDSIGGLNEYLDSNTGKIERNKAAWNDLLTTAGQLFLPFVPAATQFFTLMNSGFNTLKTVVASFMVVMATYLTMLRMLMSGQITSLDELKEKFKEVSAGAKELIYNDFFPEGTPEGAPEWFKNSVSPYLRSPQDTPTSGMFGGGEEGQAAEEKRKAVEDAEEKIQDIMQDSADKKLDIEIDYARKLEDIARDYSQKLEDIARQTAEKREDALRNYNQKIEDINRDANQKIAEAREEDRQQEIDREAKFQNKLRELREKLLFDLEDALHERDARQVLRLLRQYALDKKNLEERHKLERVQARKDLADKIADIERERQLKLEAARREYDEKLQEIAIGEARALEEARIWKSRQLADARQWHQRQLQEQREYLQRRLRDLADALAKEYEMSASAANAIYSMLSSYAGAASGLSATMMGGASRSLTNASYGGSYPNQQAGIGSGLYNPYDVRAQRGFAEGGTLLANRPTTVTFGERGLEQATFTPLGRVGRDEGRLFGNLSGSSENRDGRISLSVVLSPDLEARIIDSSLEGVSLNIEKLLRGK